MNKVVVCVTIILFITGVSVAQEGNEVLDRGSIDVYMRVMPYAQFFFGHTSVDIVGIIGETNSSVPVPFWFAANTPVRVQLESEGFGENLLDQYVEYELLTDGLNQDETKSFSGAGKSLIEMAHNGKSQGQIHVWFRGMAFSQAEWWKVQSDKYRDRITATVYQIN